MSAAHTPTPEALAAWQRFSAQLLSMHNDVHHALQEVIQLDWGDDGDEREVIEWMDLVEAGLRPLYDAWHAYIDTRA
jgi:hypothetical protein